MTMKTPSAQSKPPSGSGLFLRKMSCRAQRRVALWLFAVAGLVVAMVLVGGLTRLTDSGLSITEWRPVTGALPPLSDTAWEVEFGKYREIPEYALVNKGMSLAEFKVIYYWEWGHRLLGRIVGLVFLLPFLGFLVTRQFDRRTAILCLGLFALGGLQGFVGWFMVQSGLTARVDVSQYRLALHLGLAVAIFAALYWTGLGLWKRSSEAAFEPAPMVTPEIAPKRWGQAGLLLAGLIYLQIVLGAFVAGLDAGLASSTWPLMNGALVPSGLWELQPWWRNPFENPLTAQFAHRLAAYIVAASALVLWLRACQVGLAAPFRKSLGYLVWAVCAQVFLGIATVLAAVPIWLAALHQLGALALFAFALHAAHSLKGRAPVTNSSRRAPSNRQFAESA